MSAGRVLVVDDKASNLKLFTEILESTHRVGTAEGGGEALAKLAAAKFDVVVTDVRMPQMDGFDLLRQVKRLHPDVEVILMTAFGSIPKAVEAIKEGASNYLTKPLDPDVVIEVVSEAVVRKRSRDRARGEAPLSTGPVGLLGETEVMKKLFHLIDRAARGEMTVLISGESGTGKELIARSVHHSSARREGAFVPINCGAIPHALLESELFGHEKGAFTGAHCRKVGLFTEANEGTLFLDEVGELPLEMQVKLNRVLQERSVRSVGSTREQPIDVRIIGATNLDLAAEVAAGRFREDLFYRLNVFPLRAPPLRERREDIPVLAEAFLRSHRGSPARRLSPAAWATLTGYDWPGNVRQLENAIEWAAAICETEQIESTDLPDELTGGESVTSMGLKEVVDLARNRASKAYLLALLRRCEGNVSEAAEHAGVERESLYRLLKKYGINARDYRAGA